MADHPTYSLRLPASIVQQIAEGKEFYLHPEGKRGDGTHSSNNRNAYLSFQASDTSKGASETAHDVDEEHQHVETLQLQSDAPVDIYSSIEDGKAENKKRRHGDDKNHVLKFLGCAKRYKSLVSADDVGKKTRALLEEQRAKRKEIVRMDIDSSKPVTKQRKIVTSTATITKAKKSRPVKKRKRSSKQQMESALQEENVDDWMPHVHVSKDIKDRAGTIVRLYGVPKGCMPSDITKFFSGLSPAKVFACIPFPGTFTDRNNCFMDDGYYGRKSGKGLTVIPRESSELRVFVQFQSAAIAHLACERSGEACLYHPDVDLGSSDSDPDVKGHAGFGVGSSKKNLSAAILVSPVIKEVGNFILRNMVCDIIFIFSCILYPLISRQPLFDGWRIYLTRSDHLTIA